MNPQEQLRLRPFCSHGNFTIWPLCHEEQLRHLATLPTGVTSPCISVEPPCESCQNGRHNEPMPVFTRQWAKSVIPKAKDNGCENHKLPSLYLLVLPSMCNKCMTLSVLETSLPMQRSHDTLASGIWAKNWCAKRNRYNWLHSRCAIQGPDFSRLNQEREKKSGAILQKMEFMLRKLRPFFHRYTHTIRKRTLLLSFHGTLFSNSSGDFSSELEAGRK